MGPRTGSINGENRVYDDGEAGEGRRGLPRAAPEDAVLDVYGTRRAQHRDGLVSGVHDSILGNAGCGIVAALLDAVTIRVVGADILNDAPRVARVAEREQGDSRRTSAVMRQERVAPRWR